MSAELEAHMAVVVSEPLQFNDQVNTNNSIAAAGGLPDVFGPTLAGPSVAVGHLNCKESARTTVLEMQLGAVTRQVYSLQIAAKGEAADPATAPLRLFQGTKPPLVPAAPVRRSSPPQDPYRAGSGVPQRKAGGQPVAGARCVEGNAVAGA